MDVGVCVSEALDSLECTGPTHRLSDLDYSPRTLLPRGSLLFYQVGVVSGASSSGGGEFALNFVWRCLRFPTAVALYLETT